MLALSVLKKHLDNTFGRTPEGLAQQVETLDKILPGGRGRILRVLMNQIDVYGQKLQQNKNVTQDYAASVEKYHQSAAYKIRSAWNRVQSELIRLYDNIKGPGVDSIIAALKVAQSFIGVIADLTGHGSHLKDIIVPLGAAFLAWKFYMLGAAAAEALLTGESFILWFIRAAAATDIMTASMIALDAALLSNPLVLIGLALAALVGLIVVMIMHWDRVKAAGAAAWQWIATAAGNAFGFIRSHWQILLFMLTGGVGLLVVWVVGHFNQIIGFIRSLPGRAAKAGAGMWDWVRNSFRGAINWVIRHWNGLQFKTPEINALGVHIGSTTIGVPDIPYLASGGHVSVGGAAVVGDAGPEVVELPAGAKVRPLHPNFGAKPSRHEFDLSGAIRSLAKTSRRPIANNIYMDGKLFYRVISQYAADGAARA
jgi:hypothetical protein